MIDRKRAITAIVTLLIAAAVGHVMQNGLVFASHKTEPRVKSAVAPHKTQVPEMNTLASSLPTPPTEAILPPALRQVASGKLLRLAHVGAGVPLEALQDPQTPVFAQTGCKPALKVLSEPGAMLRLSVAAPCYKAQRIRVGHAGLSFADLLDADGTYRVSIPALDEAGKVIVEFADGTTAGAAALTLTLDGYERAGVMWSGADALNVHAFEFGAGYDDPGHVWSGAPRTPEFGVKALGGFLTELGNADVFNPQLAQVYSFPHDRMSVEGQVTFSLEAAVTNGSCGQDIDGQTFTLDSDGTIAFTSLSLAMPACDVADGYLVLNNLLQDMKIARN